MPRTAGRGKGSGGSGQRGGGRPRSRGALAGPRPQPPSRPLIGRRWPRALHAANQGEGAGRLGAAREARSRRDSLGGPGTAGKAKGAAGAAGAGAPEDGARRRSARVPGGRCRPPGPRAATYLHGVQGPRGTRAGAASAGAAAEGSRRLRPASNWRPDRSGLRVLPGTSRVTRTAPSGCTARESSAAPAVTEMQPFAP